MGDQDDFNDQGDWHDQSHWVGQDVKDDQDDLVDCDDCDGVMTDDVMSVITRMIGVAKMTKISRMG